MTLACEAIPGMVGSLDLVKSCDMIANGMIRISTPFQYIDGSSIDVFLEDSKDGAKDYIVSDLGQTTDFLLQMGIRAWATQKRKQVINDICSLHGVCFSDGEISTKISHENEAMIKDGILRVAQASARIGDILFSLRLSQKGHSKHLITSPRLLHRPVGGFEATVAKPDAVFR